jgi:hypothetical protein
MQEASATRRSAPKLRANQKPLWRVLFPSSFTVLTGRMECQRTSVAV